MKLHGYFRSSAAYRVRIGLSSPENREDVVTGLTRLRRLLAHGPTGYDSPA